MSVMQTFATVKQITAKAPIITNLSVATAGTEYSHALQLGSKIVQFQLRGNANLKFCFTVNESNINYITLNRGCSYEIIHSSFRH
jgi:hypothetical protein